MSIVNPRNILVLQAGGIGDLVMSIPALKALREAFPNSQIGLYAVSRAADLIAETPYIDHILRGALFESTGKSLVKFIGSAWQSLKTWRNLYDFHPDLIVDLNAVESCKAAIKRAILLTPLARHRAGRNTDRRGFYLTHKAQENLFGDQHEVHRILSVIKALGITPSSTTLNMPFVDRYEEEALFYLQTLGIDDPTQIIGINPCAFRPTRNWGEENFTALVHHVQSNHPQKTLLIFGGPDDTLLVQRIVKATKTLPISGLSLGGLCALLARCELFITNDTGPMHLAAAMHTPVFAIFGPENAARYGPFLPDDQRRIIQHHVPCAPCTLYECIHLKHRCMTELTQEQAFTQLDAFIHDRLPSV